MTDHEIKKWTIPILLNNRNVLRRVRLWIALEKDPTVSNVEKLDSVLVFIQDKHGPSLYMFYVDSP